MKTLRIIAKIGKYIILALMGLLSIAGINATTAIVGNYYYDLKKKGWSREAALWMPWKEYSKSICDYVQRFRNNGAKGWRWYSHNINF